MLRRVILAFCLLVLSLINAAPSIASQSQFAIKIEPGKPSFRLSSPPSLRLNTPVDLHIRLYNNSNKPVSFLQYDGYQHGEADYIVDIKMSNGQNVLGINNIGYTEQSLPTLLNGFYKPTNLEPGSFLGDNIILNRIYDMSVPGRYIVQVKRKLPAELGGYYVLSNKAVIIVE
jgi:hypothetical protein